MGDKQRKPSTSWAISAGLSYSGGGAIFPKNPVGPGRAHLGLTLLDVNEQIFYPLSLGIYTIGAGLPVGLTVSTFSPTFFTTAKELRVGDFSGSGIFASAEMCVGIGGSLTYLTFKGIDHSPYWLDIGGLEAGVAAGLSGGIFLAHAYENDGKSNDGCLIAPGGDPLCGGSSKPANKSESPNMQSKSN